MFLVIGLGYLAGEICGALAHTPALAGARERLRASAGPAADVAVAYSVACPFGAIGALLCLQLARRYAFAPSEAPAEASEILVRDFAVKNPGVAGRTIEEVLSLDRDPGFVVSRISRDGRFDLATPDTRLALDDIVGAVGEEEALERAQQIFGQPSEELIDGDYIRGTAETDFGSVAPGMVLGVLPGNLPLPAPRGTVLRRGLAGGPC